LKHQKLKKATHSKEQEFFNLIKVRESFNNILKTIEYLIGEYNHSTKDKEKYAMKINDLVDSLLVNIEDLQEEMSEGCNEYFEHHLVNYIDYICLIFPKNLNNTKITAISETIHLDYYPLPEFEKED